MNKKYLLITLLFFLKNPLISQNMNNFIIKGQPLIVSTSEEEFEDEEGSEEEQENEEIEEKI